MVSYSEMRKILEDLDENRSWDLSETNHQTPTIDDKIHTTLDAFERSHQIFSDRYRVWVHNGVAGRWPDRPDDDPDEDSGTETISWEEAKARSQWKNGIEQIRDIIFPVFEGIPLFQIINNDGMLRGDKNHAERGDTLYLLLSAWGKWYRRVRIQDAKLEEIFTDKLKICTSRHNAGEVVDRLEKHSIILKKKEKMKKRHGVGTRSSPNVYWVPNPELFGKLSGAVAAIQVMNRLPAIIDIVATMQLDRDAALETLKDHGLLDEYEQRRSVPEILHQAFIPNNVDAEESDPVINEKDS